MTPPSPEAKLKAPIQPSPPNSPEVIMLDSSPPTPSPKPSSAMSDLFANFAIYLDDTTFKDLLAPSSSTKQRVNTDVINDTEEPCFNLRVRLTTPNGKQVSIVRSKLSDTISDLKSRIVIATGISAVAQELSLPGKDTYLVNKSVLEDTLPVTLKKGFSYLELIDYSREPIDIIVRDLEWNRIRVVIRCDETVRVLKERVKMRTGVREKEGFRLLFDGVLMRDEVAVTDYGVGEGSVVVFVPRRKWEN